MLLRAEAAGQRARAGEHAAALAETEARLTRFAGPPADDPRRRSARCAARRPRGVHRSVTRALALSRLGRHTEALPVLTVLAAGSPRDEELLVKLLRSEPRGMRVPGGPRQTSNAVLSADIVEFGR